MTRRMTATRIDFDRWSRLARENPDAFERYRSEMIEALIRSAEPGRQRRLRQVQWRIDQERRRAGNPVAACIALSRMMWDQVYGPAGLLAAISHLEGRWSGRSDTGDWPPGPGARVLPFPSQR